MQPLLHLYSLKKQHRDIDFKTVGIDSMCCYGLQQMAPQILSTGRRFIVRWANELDCFYNIYFFSSKWKIFFFYFCLFLQNLFKFNYRERKHNFNEQSFSLPSPLTLFKQKRNCLFVSFMGGRGRSGQMQFLQSANRKVILNISIKLNKKNMLFMIYALNTDLV